ncbi:hypothetical protein C2G38_2255114 [Gigaspora rosea]|uniref:Uncharacterized protein n=1 Tax=Gigaspora rosea TaxID=44941 RepID=A0A397U269_9GLOM|nr:hypothetical protein C2G38_2255114 [Gigaspora rosea]
MYGTYPKNRQRNRRRSPKEFRCSYCSVKGHDINICPDIEELEEKCATLFATLTMEQAEEVLDLIEETCGSLYIEDKQIPQILEFTLEILEDMTSVNIEDTIDIVYLPSYINVMDESIFHEEYSQKTQDEEVVYLNVDLPNNNVPTMILEDRCPVDAFKNRPEKLQKKRMFVPEVHESHYGPEISVEDDDKGLINEEKNLKQEEAELSLKTVREDLTDTYLKVLENRIPEPTKHEEPLINLKESLKTEPHRVNIRVLNPQNTEVDNIDNLKFQDHNEDGNKIDQIDGEDRIGINKGENNVITHCPIHADFMIEIKGDEMSKGYLGSIKINNSDSHFNPSGLCYRNEIGLKRSYEKWKKEINRFLKQTDDNVSKIKTEIITRKALEMNHAKEIRVGIDDRKEPDPSRKPAVKDHLKGLGENGIKIKKDQNKIFTYTQIHACMDFGEDTFDPDRHHENIVTNINRFCSKKIDHFNEASQPGIGAESDERTDTTNDFGKTYEFWKKNVKRLKLLNNPKRCILVNKEVTLHNADTVEKGKNQFIQSLQDLNSELQEFKIINEPQIKKTVYTSGPKDKKKQWMKMFLERTTLIKTIDFEEDPIDLIVDNWKDLVLFILKI